MTQPRHWLRGTMTRSRGRFQPLPECSSLSLLYPSPERGIGHEAARIPRYARCGCCITTRRASSAARQIRRLCFLTFDPAASRTTRFDAFFQGLRDLGYVDGKTITIDYLSANGDGERFPSLAAECVRLKAAIIVVTTTPATQAAKKATRSIPIVMIGLGDPVGTGLVDSLALPGGNVTGMSMMASEVAAKRLELLKEAVPGISRVLVLSYLADPIAPLQVKSLEKAASALGVTLQIHDIRTADDFPVAFEDGAKEHAEGLLTTAESIFVAQRARVSELAARYRLPAM